MTGRWGAMARRSKNAWVDRYIRKARAWRVEARRYEDKTKAKKDAKARGNCTARGRRGAPADSQHSGAGPQMFRPLWGRRFGRGESCALMNDKRDASLR